MAIQIVFSPKMTYPNKSSPYDLLFVDNHKFAFFSNG